MTSLRGLNFFTTVGDAHGAGIAGKGFALALADRVDLRLSIHSPPGFDLAAQVVDPREVGTLQGLAARAVSPRFPAFVRGAPSSRRWLCPEDWPRRRSPRFSGAQSCGPFVAHIFFEFEKLSPQEIDWLREADLVTTASEWASQVLREHGLADVATVHQGVELDVFRPLSGGSDRPPELEGKFVVFVGGKYEYRKGIDLAIAAFARFRQRHRDAVLLINAYNPWPWTQSGLAHSPHFHFTPITDYPRDLERVLVANGIPPEGFWVLAPAPRHELAAAMAASDCGLFPIRCEGGTNHFLMEYMACGRPVVATWTTGLTDLLHPEENCVGLRSLHPVPANLVAPQPERGCWHEPSLDEMLAGLELLYSSRETGERLARAGLQTIQRFAWPNRAERLLEVIDTVAST